MGKIFSALLPLFIYFLGSLNCSRCESELLKDSDLFFYRPVKSEIHLAVKFERTEHVLNERGTLIECPIQLEEGKAYSVKVSDIKCKNCNSTVAFRIHNGPNRDSLLCISLKETFNLLSDGTKISNSMPGGGTARKKVLENFLEQRNISEFYGSKMTSIKSDSLIGSLVHPTIDDLNTVEMNELVKDKPRSYQIECFCAASMFSSIIQIPTGSGKTHISVMLASLYKKLNPNRMVWFLTDRIPLVFQQARYIENQTSLTVLPLAGDVQTALNPSQLIKYDVLVCTVQLLINMLVIGQIRITDVSLVIIDEIHHAVRNHPYVVFIETFLSQITGADRPRLLGLTASPAAGNPIQMKLQLKDLSRLCAAQLYTPCIYRNDLESTVNRPNTHFIPVALTIGESKLSQAIFENIQELLTDESCPCSTLEEVRMNLRGLTVKSHQDHKLAAKLYNVNQLLTALEMTSILGSHYSREFLLDFLKPNCGDLEGKSLSPCEENILKICQEEADEEEKNTARGSNISPKFKALCKLLESIDLVSAPETRMIIFVETKRTARWLASSLQNYLTRIGLSEWNATAFVGQASNSVDGMSWSTEQRPILALFRSGHVKLLIATSVLQEGLDVAACNQIVLFDRTWSLTAFLQSRGRARAQDSNYTIICSADDENYYTKLFDQEIILSKMVRDEMVNAQVLSLQLAMSCIHLKVKSHKLEFSQANPNVPEIDETGLLGEIKNLEKIEEEEDDSEYNLTVNLHNVQEETFDGPCQLNLALIDHRRDHLRYFGDQEEVIASIDLPAIALKSIRRSWIQLSEELLDTLIEERFPDSLIELDRLIPELLTGVSNVPVVSSITIEMQRLAVGAMDSGNKFIEAVSQHHSFTPTMSLLLFDPLSRKINALFQESLEKTFRFEIAYDSIDSFCLLFRNETQNADSNFSLIIPVKTPPLLYISTEDVSSFEIEKKIDEIYWERVAADSFSDRLNGVFSACPAIKVDLFLNGMTSRKLFQVLCKIGSNILYTSKLHVEAFPEFHSLWLVEVEQFLGSLNDFEVEYRLRSILCETWSKTSLRLSQEWLQLASTASNQALDLFINKLSTNRFIDPFECLRQAICGTEEILEKSLENVQGALSVKLVTWTPSRIIFQRPTLFLSNRVLREFGPDHFIRVHFRDEDFDKLSIIRANASIDNLLNVGVKGALDNGICIGGRRFEFLAMSSSQLRGHGCWFVDEQIGAEKIRSWLGKFDEIRNIAKYVARLGQSFSASKPTLTVSSYEPIEDWKNEKYIFSDGCGMISLELAREVAQKLNLPKVPSAYQIRFAGFKGVVAVYPQNSSPLALRPSMKKFETHHRGLDILNIAEPFPCYLNRQVILILSALGVPDSSFETLQLNHLKYLAECFNTNGIISVKDLNVSDLDHKDPFMRTLISAQYRQQLTELLTKTRIAVPQGRILMGVIDESGILAENEVFCQIDDDHLNNFVVEGKVMIAKNPCMHPGDVRVLTAIKSPELEAYSRNVIVFSRNGTRPIPNMCSGSDLDGDLYFVTWDQGLIPPKTDEPMSYEGLPASEKSDPITDEDLKDFMVFFIKNDQLGTIANTHVAFSDQLEDGVRDPACMALARLFSLAVDFPKTGFVAKVPKEVRVKKYPDFMQKLDKPSYVSHRIIGTLFREIKAVMNEEIPDDLARDVRINRKFLVAGYEEYVKEARKLYEDYTMDISQCLTQYGFRMESHLLMSCTIAIDIAVRELNTDALEIAQVVFKHHVRRYQEIFDSLAGNNPELRAKLASAWYYAAYSDPITPVGFDAPILSFPWVILNRPEYPRDKDARVQELIAEDMKNWFIGTETCENEMIEQQKATESTSLIDILSQKLSLLQQIHGLLASSSELKLCLREFLLTGKIFLYVEATAFESLTVKLLKFFPAAVIKPANDNEPLSVTIDSTNLIFQSTVIDRKQKFSSQFEYIKAYLCNQFYAIDLDIEFNSDSVADDCTPLEFFDNLVAIEQVPKALRSWNDWILSAKDSIYLNLTNGLLEVLDELISSGTGPKINLVKIRHILMCTCRIKYALAIANEHYRSGQGLQSKVVKSIMKNPRILRQIGGGSAAMGPLGNSVYVQGAAKIVFVGSSGEGDLLKFGIYEGSRQIHHLVNTCYRVALKSGQMLSDDTFAFNEYWTHLHRQFHYLRRFGSLEYGKLHLSVKLGQFYVTELPRMFMEQPVSIWLARVALEKTFKSGRWGRKKTNTNAVSDTKKEADNNEDKMDFSQLKFNPRSGSNVDETISSNRVTQSLQSLLESAESGELNASATGTENTTAAGNSTKEQRSKKSSSKSFGKMSTAFEAAVDEETAKKFLSMWKFERETTLHVTLTCYDESSNTNVSLQVHYEANGEDSRNYRLKSISQRSLRWAVVDVLTEGEKSFDARISVSSFNTKTEDLESTIFSKCLIEGSRKDLRVSEDFRSNPTIYSRFQEGFSAKLRDDFSLIIRRISESIGVDPQTGHFAVNQDKWEIEAKMTLDWDEIHDYQYRDQLILTIWSICKSLRR